MRNITQKPANLKEILNRFTKDVSELIKSRNSGLINLCLEGKNFKCPNCSNEYKINFSTDEVGEAVGMSRQNLHNQFLKK